MYCSYTTKLYIQCFWHLSRTDTDFTQQTSYDKKLWTSFPVTCLEKQSLICGSLISLQSGSNHFLKLKNWFASGFGKQKSPICGFNPLSELDPIGGWSEDIKQIRFPCCIHNLAQERNFGCINHGLRISGKLQ